MTLERETIQPQQILDHTMYVGLEDVNGDTGIVTPREVNSGELRSAKFQFGPQHILYGKLRPNLRKVARPEMKGVCSTDILPLLPGVEVDRGFLFHWLRQSAIVDAVSARASGVNLPRISPKHLLQLQVPLPPLAEQRRIAALLDRADAVRRRREESRRLVDELLRSVFLEMFGDPVAGRVPSRLPLGWVWQTVDAVAANRPGAIVGGPFGSDLTAADYVPSAGVPVIRGSNLTSGEDGFLDDGFAFVSSAKAASLGRNTAKPGDVIVTQRGTLGQVARIPTASKYPQYVVSQSQMRVTFDKSKLEPAYFVHYLLSPAGIRELKSRTLATGVPHINLSLLKSFPVLVPPLALQQRFVGIVTAIGCLKARLSDTTEDQCQLSSVLAQSCL